MKWQINISLPSITRLSVISLLSLMLWWIVIGCHRSPNSDALGKIDKQCAEALSMGDTKQLDSIANILLIRAQQYDNRLLTAKAYYYLGTYCQTTPDLQIQRLKYLDQALATIAPDDTLLHASIYNTKGLWCLSKLRYDSALIYFEDAINLARSCSDQRLEAAIESNLSDVYSFLNDTIGYAYTLRLYYFAKSRDFAPLVAKAAYKCAEYISDIGNDSLHLELFLNEISNSPQLKGWDRVFRSNFLLNSGKAAHAAKELDSIPTDLFHYVYPNVIKANILAANGKNAESNAIAYRALKMYDEIHQDHKWPELYRLISNNYATLGKRDSSLIMLQRYVETHDSVTQMINGLQVNSYRVRYEVGKKEQELKLAKADTERMRIIITFVIAIVALSTFGTLWYIRRIKRHHRLIVTRTREALRREQLQPQLQPVTSNSSKIDTANKTAPTDNIPTEKENNPISDSTNASVSGPSKERSDEIFSKITFEMEANRVWTDVNITRDTFAELVGCNRTYFSQVIKNNTGMSYTQFMNARRVHEAVKILGEPTEIPSFTTISRDFGFLSESTFYAAFRQIMGMTPATYRKIALEDISTSNN